MLNYIEIEGLRKNSNLIYVECEKQLYRKNCFTKKFCVYKCREKHCKSRVKIDLQSRICTKVDNFQPHNHLDREKEFKKIQVISKIKRDCADPRIPKYRGFAVANTRQIYNENITEFQVDPEHVDYNKMQRNLLRIRQTIINMKEENNGDATKAQSNPGKDENDHYSAEDNFSDDDNDSSQDCDGDETVDESTYDPLVTEYDIPKETNEMISAPPACPPPIRMTLVEECVKDEHQMTGQVIGTKLKNMDMGQQIIAEKLISDVLYYGRLGMLEIETRLQNLKIAPT